MNRNEVTTPNRLIDFLTFVSPVFVVAIFFLCLFRFLFRCCFCNTKNLDIEDGSIPTCCQNHCTRFLNHNLNLNNATNMCPSSPAMFPSGVTNCCHHVGAMPIMDDPRLNVTLLQNSYPPRYEDALKLPAPTPRDLEAVNVTTRTITEAAIRHPAINGPPPFYDNSSRSRSGTVDQSHSTANYNNLEPPAYSISVISSSALDNPAQLFYSESDGIAANPSNLPVSEITQVELIPQQQRPCSSTNSCTSSSSLYSTNQLKEISHLEVVALQQQQETNKPSIRRPVRFMTASISTFVSKSGGSQRRKSLKSEDMSSKMENGFKKELKRPLTTTGVVICNPRKNSLKDENIINLNK